MKAVSLEQTRRGLQIHAFVFGVAMLVMAALNILYGPPYWFVWPLLGWGIGLLAHRFFTLGPGAARNRSA